MPRCAAPRTIGKRAAATAATAAAHGLGRWTGLSRGEVFCTGIRTISSGASLSWTLLAAREIIKFLFLPRICCARSYASASGSSPASLFFFSAPLLSGVVPRVDHSISLFVRRSSFLSFFLSPSARLLYFRVGRLAGIRARAARLPASLSRLAAVRRDRVRELIRSRLDR